MTERKKAKDIYFKHLLVQSYGDPSIVLSSSEINKAKLSSIIHVDGIIEALNNSPEALSLKKVIAFHQEVKRIIEEL